MPFNSAGVYTPAAGATTAAPGQLIQSAIWNAIHTDFSNALTLLGQQLYGSTSVAIGASPYAPVATDTLLLVHSAGGAITITLPLASSRLGYPIVIKDADGSARTNNITINRSGSDTIDSLTTLKVATAFGWYKLLPVLSGSWIMSP